MDGVLIDVSNSYRQAIIQTVDLYFTAGLGMKYGGPLKPLLTAADVDVLKQAGGFNNDWDLTTAFIIYFLEMLPPQSVITYPLQSHVPATLAYLQAVGNRLQMTMYHLRQNKNIERLARGVADLGGGLAAVRQLLKRNNRHLLTAHGSPLEGNLVQRIFQELYLGKTLFEQIYQTQTVIAHEAGLINNEHPILEPAILDGLAQRFKLAIATGRPRAEADYSLKHFQIDAYFTAVITHDDVVAAAAKGKPDPWSLLEAARYIQPQPQHCVYIGDTPDDIRAAKAAHQTQPFLAVGSLAASQDQPQLQTAFKNLQADLIIDHPNQLRDIFLS
jgi:HAD superfamily hydrolase (TIGR01548 family)